jgi:hypothetical protein
MTTSSFGDNEVWRASVGARGVGYLIFFFFLSLGVLLAYHDEMHITGRQDWICLEFEFE